MHEIETEKEKIQSDPTKLSVLFKEMIQMCLWYLSSLPLIGYSAPNIRLTKYQGERDGPFSLDPYDRGRH